MPTMTTRLRKEVPVDFIVEKLIIDTSGNFTSLIVEPADQYGKTKRGTVDKVFTEDGVPYVLTTEGTRVGMITRVEHQGYVYSDLRK